MSTLRVADPVLVDFAAEVGTDGPVAVEGGRTRWDVGGRLAPETRLLRAPTGVVAHTPSEMTVTVRAGTPVSELDGWLAAEGQRCALPDRGGTVGGAIVIGENHRDVRARGRVRDAVLQVRYVGSGGELVTGGGPVVKNVTGFNLPRLLVGSLGTLGLLAEVVLRVNPIPASVAWFRTSAEPLAVDGTLYRPAAILHDGHEVWTLLEGHPDDVAAQADLLTGLGATEPADAPPELPAHRWSLRPSDAATFDRAAGPAVASIGVGTVWASAPQPESPIDPGTSAIARRTKQNFDPDGRLNPGRHLAGVAP